MYVLLLAADDVCTEGLDEQEVLTLEEVDADGVIGWEEGLKLYGQETEDLFL